MPPARSTFRAALRPLPLALALAFTALHLPAALAQSKSQNVQVVSATPNATVLRVIVPKPVFNRVQTPEGEFSRFAMREGGFAVDGSAVGQAELPVGGFSLALPVDGEGEVVDVQPEGGITRLSARIYPVQPADAAFIGSEKIEPTFAFDKTAYSRGVRKPGELGQPLSLAKGDVNVRNFKLAPYGYDPAQELVTFYSSYLVTVRHPGTCLMYDRLLNKDWLATRQDQGFDAIDQRVEALPHPALDFAINRGLAVELKCAPKLSIRPVPGLFGARFLIITHPNLVDAANDLRAHKQAMGISTRVVTTSQITGGSANATKTQIRDWIANEYNTRIVRPKWVMFMGDAELIPTNYDEISPFVSDPNAPEYARSAGDMWYGQFRPGDDAFDIPPFGIGRLPVDTLSQAQTIVNKIKAYENFPPVGLASNPTFYNRFTFASFFESAANGTTDKRWFVETSEIIRNHLLGLGYTVQRHYEAPSWSTPTYYNSGALMPADLRSGFSWNATGTDVMNSVNAGSAILFHRDHGGNSGWGHPSLSTSDLVNFSVTGNRFPLVINVNCASSIFDNETVNQAPQFVSPGLSTSPSSTYFAETLIRKQDGAIGVIGDTRLSSTVANNHLSLGLFDGLFPGLLSYGTSTPVRRLGDLLNYAKTYLNDVNSNTATNSHPLKSDGTQPGVPTLRHQLNIYNLFGDPTVKLRLFGPLFSPALVQIGSIKLTRNLVSVQLAMKNQKLADGDWVSVVALDPDTGAVLGRAVADEGGAATIDLGDVTVKNVVVRASASEGTVDQRAFEESDSDGDGVADSRDNCTKVANANQRDSDGDGYGDTCDADANNDGIVNSLDLSLINRTFNTRDPRGDLNGDGIVNSLDLSRVNRLFGTVPGPSAWHPRR